MKVTDKLTVNCTKITNLGMGVVYVDQFPFFVSNLLPNETAIIEIFDLKSKYGIGRVVKRLSDSPDRIEPICPYFDECGGCQLMHMRDQSKFKQSQVEKILKTQVEPLVFSPQSLYYRNKMIFQSNMKEIGFYQQRTNTVIDIDYCYLQSELMNNILNFIRNNYTNLSEVTIRGDKEIMVDLTGDDPDPLPLLNEFEEIKSLYINKQHTHGSSTITTAINGLKFRLSLESFFQVNSKQTEFLYNKVIELGNFKSTDTVLDLYCGIGTITLSVAKHVKKVIGVELNEQAIQDANTNKHLNQINNVDFICEDATKYLKETQEQFDVVIVDPPRKGLTKQGISDLISTKANRLIYVSCNPVTLKRDLDLLKDYYLPKTIIPFDMFPQTYHVELVALMSRE